MRSTLLLTFGLILLLFLGSCNSVKIAAGPGQEVYLANAEEQLPFRTQKMNWYVLWGAVPVMRAQTSKIIEDNELKKVRMETKYSVGNYLINIILGYFSIHTNTLIIEGDSKAPEKKKSGWD